jgi:hypothetical protein
MHHMLAPCVCFCFITSIILTFVCVQCGWPTLCAGMRERAAFLLFYGMTHACRFPLVKISTEREEICVEWSVLARSLTISLGLCVVQRLEFNCEPLYHNLGECERHVMLAAVFVLSNFKRNREEITVNGHECSGITLGGMFNQK